MRISTTTGALLAISLLAISASARTTTSDTSLSDSSATTTGSSGSSSGSDSSSITTTDASSSTTGSSSTGGTSTSGTSTSGTASSSTGGTASSTASSSGSATLTGSSLSSITTTSDASSTGFPTLSGAYSYPSASVPPTSNAPYMRNSSYPEGTIFIAVGAILGAAAFAVLAWRGLVAWSLHRSVTRAANSSSMADAKSQFRTPAAPFYQYTDRESTMSLANMGGKSKDKKSKTASTTPAAHALFFSPTAGKGLQAGNRGSSYLPAGYYAAGAGNATNGSQSGFSLTNLGPPMQGYARAHSIGATPPDSPNMRARDTSRAPSAFLEDMIDEGVERGRR